MLQRRELTDGLRERAPPTLTLLAALRGTGPLLHHALRRIGNPALLIGLIAGNTDHTPLLEDPAEVSSDIRRNVGAMGRNTNTGKRTLEELLRILLIEVTRNDTVRVRQNRDILGFGRRGG